MPLSLFVFALSGKHIIPKKVTTIHSQRPTKLRRYNHHKGVKSNIIGNKKYIISQSGPADGIHCQQGRFFLFYNKY